MLALTARGQVLPFETRLDERVAAIAGHQASGRVACAAAGDVAVFRVDDTGHPQWLRHAHAITGLAFSPDGRVLAGSHGGGVCLWRLDESLPPHELAMAGEPVTVTWSPDGQWLACPLAEEGFHLHQLADDAGGAVLGYPTPTPLVSLEPPGNAIVTAGAYRAAAWSMADPPLADASQRCTADRPARAWWWSSVWRRTRRAI